MDIIDIDLLEKLYIFKKISLIYLNFCTLPSFLHLKIFSGFFCTSYAIDVVWAK